MQTQVADRAKPMESVGRKRLSCPLCGNSACVAELQAPDRFHGKRQMYQLLRCPSCLVVWLMDPPQASEMAQHYGSDYDQRIAAHGESQVEGYWRDPRNMLLRYKSGGSILDLGCSSGGFLSSLKDSDWRRYGIEISPEVATRARVRAKAEVFVGDVLDAPFRPETFDAITCFHVFEHMYEPREVLERLMQWLRPGGVFIAYMPNIDSAGARIFGSCWYALELPRHLYHFSPASLRNLATSVGFEEISVTTDRELFFESSCRYVCDDLLRRVGINRRPMANGTPPSIPFRVIRKAFRLTLLPLLESLATFAGDGETIHSVFRKKINSNLESR